MLSAAFLETLGLTLDPQENPDADEEDEKESDVSANSDIFNIDVLADKDFTTEQDLDIELISDTATHLRARPLLPHDPKDAASD